jgi:hypothetical protein
MDSEIIKNRDTQNSTTLRSFIIDKIITRENCKISTMLLLTNLKA